MDMDVRLAKRIGWLLRQSPKRLNFIGKARWAGLPEDCVGELAWATYRRRTGLEARASIALAMAPEVIPEAHGSLCPGQILNPALAALTALLLDTETPAAVRERARADLAGRGYLPSASDTEGWAAEARACLAELKARRVRWDVRSAEQRSRRGNRGRR